MAVDGSVQPVLILADQSGCFFRRSIMLFFSLRIKSVWCRIDCRLLPGHQIGNKPCGGGCQHDAVTKMPRVDVEVLDRGAGGDIGNALG